MNAATPALLEAIADAGDAEALRGLAPSIPKLLVTLVEAGQPARAIGEQISAAGEAISQRLLELAEQQLGPPPVDYAFVVAGSLARREQIAGSDQDNALILADDFRRADHDPYFAALGRFVCDHLAACGYVHCPGNIMASNAQWRLTLSEWQHHFRHWIDEPDPQALLELCIFFDLRHQHGAPGLVEQLRRDFLARASSSPLFQAHLAAAAQGFRPALSWLGRLRFRRDEHGSKRLDLKRHGIAPLVDLARTDALAHGLDCLSTVERLRAMMDIPDIDSRQSEELMGAFERINTLRQAHQARCIRAGERPDYRIGADELDADDRRRLKRDLRTVAAGQSALLRRYRAEAFA